MEIVRNNRGFTLIEVMTALMVGGAFLAFVIPGIQKMKENSRVDQTKQKINLVVQAIDTYEYREDEYPESLDALVAADLLDEKDLQDAWKNTFVYSQEGEDCDYTVVSLGADEAEGGAKGSNDADLSSCDD